MKTVFLVIPALLLWTSAAMVEAAEMSDARKIETVYAMYAEYKNDFPAVTDIDPRQAMQLADDGQVIFIDTRKPAEMAVSMLPGAVPKAAFLADIDRYRGQTLVGYCTISYRSGVFARQMAEKGVEIRNLRGGILAWTLEGGTVYDEGKPVKRIHVYGDKWDYAPRDYQSVKFGLWEQIF